MEESQGFSIPEQAKEGGKMPINISKVKVPKAPKIRDKAAPHLEKTKQHYFQKGYEQGVGETRKAIRKEMDEYRRTHPSIIWSWEDIRDKRPNWTKEQCQEFLAGIKKTLQERSIEFGYELIGDLLPRPAKTKPQHHHARQTTHGHE